MVPLPVIVSGVLKRGLPQRSFAEEDHPIEAFVLDRPDESTRSPDLDGEEVGCGEHVPVGLEELTPSRSLAAIRRVIHTGQMRILY